MKKPIGLHVGNGDLFLIHVKKAEQQQSIVMTSFHGVLVLLGLFDANMKAAAVDLCIVGRIHAGGAREIQDGIKLVLELDTLVQFNHQLEIVLSMRVKL